MNRKRISRTTPSRLRFIIYGLLLIPAFTLLAQDTPQPSEEEAVGKLGQEKKGRHHVSDLLNELQHLHTRKLKMRHEMTQELQQQVAALRAHTQAMASLKDTQQLLAELRKHQQLTDDLLGTMVEQRLIREQLWTHSEHASPTEQQKQEGSKAAE